MNHSEATLRRDLAAAYRLAALFGWDDTLYTHFSVRLPGTEPRFLINPFGLLFEEVRASDLLVVDLHGRVIGGEADYNVAGFTIHSALHMARADAHCVIHTHTLAGMAVAASETGLTQLNQISAEFYQGLGYHDYEGIAFDLGERERLVASLAGHSTLILRHHGLLSVGASVADAFYLMYYLNKACEIQLAAAVLPDIREMPASLSRHAREQFQGVEWQRQLLWQAWLRKLERLDPAYQQ
ncbi:ribulose-5-phosphate 4-epimerase/fuculose-1-phosphate aldolase [Pseudomonas sp. SJZ079]|uniref:class II aldolase/adducin family protein n=1 Tax=Pseudomonas sp. SJZ079 TaxID=2572887 RepID=UPI00119A2686|nr:class II aldolase/adducin family protein [Pseudomonas sp. SJZ079]TWC34152.1 ribulose-5-phosphate 4-epimerase/fuculose-1-phosphate aldolase [Pseudomonas sp. SJZ079]